MDNEHYFTELKRGTIIIAVLSQLKEPLYGYKLVNKLNEAGYEVEQNTLYPLLRRLEKQKILTYEIRMNDSRERKYYSLTEDGKKLYEKLVESFNETSLILSKLIKEYEG